MSNYDKKKSAAYYQKHKEENTKNARQYQKKLYATQRGKTMMNARLAFRHGIHNVDATKFSAFWDAVGYTRAEARAHIESLFKDKMCWHTYGRANATAFTWSTDHIQPHRKFNYVNMRDESFKACWSLENIRPLGSLENITKGNK